MNKKYSVIVWLAILLILFTGFVIWFKKDRAAEPSETSVKTEEEATMAQSQLYTNDEYGFSLNLGPAFTGYRVTSSVDTVRSNVTYLNFQVPTTDQNYASGAGYATPMIIAVYPIAVWPEIENEEGPKPTYIDENDTSVFGYSTWQEAPADLKNVNFRAVEVAASFVFTR